MRLSPSVAGMLTAFATMSFLACAPPADSEEGMATGELGQADGGACALEGHWIASGDWDSFAQWHLKFEADRLVSSYTDDLAPKDWPTQLSIDPGDASKVTVRQTTFASDAILETALYLERSCQAGALSLRVLYATSATVDETDAAGDSFRRNSVTITRGSP